MTVQTSKNPQVDIAEDNAFFPSEYSLSQYTSPVSDLDGVDYPKPYRGKHKILVIAADERYLPTDNGKLFSTGNHPIETLLPLYHLHAAGFEFEVATISGLMTKFEYWAMPHKDEKVMPFFEQHKSLFRNPKKLADVVASLNADSEYAAIFVPVGMAHLLVYQKARTWLPLYSGQSKMTVLLSPFATVRRLFWHFATAITH